MTKPAYCKLALGLALLFGFLTSSQVFAQTGQYPQLDISGYKKWEFKQESVDPQTNYFKGISQLGGFYPTYSGGPWQERLRLKILGQLSKNLSVTYDLEQQPETPDKFDVKVNYHNTELTFGDLYANFSGNEFASTSRYVNGVKLTSKDTWYDLTFVPSSKLKSQNQKLTSQKGNNTKGPYSLGHGSIVEGSEHIELNGVRLQRNKDYTINYFEGKITFNQILTTNDEFKYTYEYTNILDLFFPSLSKRNFQGLQTRFTLNPESFNQKKPQAVLITKTARQRFPSSASQETTLAEEESSGRYRLSNQPVVPFSEKLTLAGFVLRKNEDYLIRYGKGYIKLLTNFLPSSQEALVVEYKYNPTSKEAKSISGINSRGAYKLRSDLVEDSERIELDNQLLIRNLGYTVDYQKGEITFAQEINETSQIKADYSYKLKSKPKIQKSKNPNELKVGLTYLNESAKQSSGAALTTVIESTSWQSVSKESNTLYLNNLPLTSSNEAGATLIVKVDGKTLTREVDYTVPTTSLDPLTGYALVSPETRLAYVNDRSDASDGYRTGTIKFLNTTFTATAPVSVTYSYYKSIVGKYSGSGDGTQGPYYLRNVRNIVPGSETLQVWEQGSSVITTYTRNSTFEADAGSTGYSINYDADNPYVTFNDPLTTTKNWQLIYQYVPPQSSVNEDIAQSLYGADASFKIGSIFKIDGAVAKSQSDQVYIAQTTSESFSGSGSRSYRLHSSKDIIENSELVSVNNKTLNKDIDYFISYSQPGQITFYYITPSTADAIAVEYQYQSLSGVSTGQDTKTGTAYRLGAETKIFGDALTVSGVKKQVDYTFTPMGSLSLANGSFYNEYKVKYQPKKFHSLAFNYAYKENNNPLSNYQNRFLRTYDNLFSLAINPNKLAKLSLSYRKYDTVDDLLGLGSQEAHSKDTKQESYLISLSPTKWTKGFATFSQQYDAKRTISLSDSLGDSNNYQNNTTDYFRSSANLSLTKRFSFGYNYQKSAPTVIALQPSSTEASSEAVANQKVTTDNSYSFSADLTSFGLKKLTTRLSFKDHREETSKKNFVSTSEIVSTRNETLRVDLIPITPLKTSYNRSRQEQTSITVGQANPKTERTTFSTLFSPYSWFQAGWNNTQSETIPQTGLSKRTSGNGNSYTAKWIPISMRNFNLSTSLTLNDSSQVAPSGTQEVKTETDQKIWSCIVKYVPLKILPISLGYSLEEYANKNDHTVVSSRIDTKTQNQSIDFGLQFMPLKALTFKGSLSQKTTKIKKDLSITGQDSRQKTVANGNLSYKIQSRTTISYDLYWENNGGEIQGGKVAALDIVKTAHTAAVNMTIPLKNPVVSNFVVTGSWKLVDYIDRNNSSNNFVAQLLKAEGTVNF